MKIRPFNGMETAPTLIFYIIFYRISYRNSTKKYRLAKWREMKLVKAVARGVLIAVVDPRHIYIELELDCAYKSQVNVTF